MKSVSAKSVPMLRVDSCTLWFFTIAGLGGELAMAALEIGGEALGRISRKGNQRKNEVYWIAFLDGIIASAQIEETEMEPLLVEAQHFIEVLNDNDANDLILDMNGGMFSSKEELLKHLEIVVQIRRVGLGHLSDRDTGNYFLGYCAGVACDARVLVREARGLLLKAQEFMKVSIDPRIEEFVMLLRYGLRDGEIDEEEGADILDMIRGFIGDSASETGLATAGSKPALPNWHCVGDDVSFEGEYVVMTGSFRAAKRSELSARLESSGAICQKAVTSETRYVVLGSNGSRDWKYNQYGTKIESALSKLYNGQDIKFCSEFLLEKYLGIGD
jgi:hypothetical protein